MSKSIDFLRDVFLIDPESDGRARIVNVEGTESGHDCLKIWTVSSEQRKNKIATMFKVYSEEVEFDPKNIQEENK